MDIKIIPITQYNSFVSSPTGNYMVDTCIGHNGYSPIYNFSEDKIPEVINKLKELLQYFKGEHIIYVQKLIWCKPYERKNFLQGKLETRNWKIVSGNKVIKELVLNPKIAKVIAYNGNSFGERGWMLKTDFGIEGINNHSFGILCSSYKSAKEHVDYIKNTEEEISHWQLEEIRRKRMIKCNICEKKVINLEAEQCSKCGRYFCKECLTDSECGDCQGED